MDNKGIKHRFNPIDNYFCKEFPSQSGPLFKSHFFIEVACFVY